TQLKTLKVADDPEPIIAKLKDALAQADAAIAAALSDAQRERLPNDKDLEEEKISVGQERTALEARRARLQETRDNQQEALENAVEARSGTTSKLEVIRNSIAEGVALCP